VTTHAWSGTVTGEDIAESLATKLGLEGRVLPSFEPEETRVRKLVDVLVGHYPQGDNVTRWIFLDGLDRPGVNDSARDFARRLISLVDEGELPNTRLVVTGLDILGLDLSHGIQHEEIPSIDRAQVKAFLTDVAAHLQREADEATIDALVAEVLGDEDGLLDLREVEDALVGLVRATWGPNDVGNVGHGA
jgi:hypothetical protein